MNLDHTTWSQLKGGFTYRDIQATGLHATKRQQGRAKRYVPVFAVNDPQLKAVILCVAVSYIYGGRTIHPDVEHEMNVVNELAKQKTQRAMDFAATNDYWERLQEHFEAIDKAGGYLALVSAIAYRAWRLNWHNSEIAGSLAMEKANVSTILVRLKRVAELMGFETTGHMGPRQQRGTDEAILALWNEGKTTGEIHNILGACQQRIVKVLKKHNVHYKRQDLQGGTHEQILELWKQGLGTTQIAAQLGTCPATVARAVKRAGVYVPHRNRNKRNVISTHNSAAAAV